MENDLEIIERDLITRFRKDIYRPFCRALDKYDILNAYLGGKDSFLLAKCMQEIQRHGNKKIELEYICMNPGFLDEVVDVITKTGKRLRNRYKICKNKYI